MRRYNIIESEARSQGIEPTTYLRSMIEAHNGIRGAARAMNVTPSCVKYFMWRHRLRIVRRVVASVETF